MAFYAGQVVVHTAMYNPTLVLLTDRKNLGDQLFATFSMCRDLLRPTPRQAESQKGCTGRPRSASGASSRRKWRCRL